MSHHVLIVEDDDSLQQLYGLYLQRGNYHHTAVSTAQEALNLLSSQSIDAILVDVNLDNEMSGLDLVEAIRNNPAYDHIKVITLTSFPEAYDTAYPSWIDLSLNKPVDYKLFISALNDVLDNRPAGDSG